MTNHQRAGLIVLGLALGLVSCAQRSWVSKAPPAPPVTPPLPIAKVPIPAPPPPDIETVKKPEPPPPTPKLVSNAKSPKDYRADAAKHLYATYPQRIFPGKMPPMLKAVGVVEVALDSRGQVQDIVWLRAPRHAPEVMREIETALRDAAPYPAPVHLKQVKYTDTWLWHASGRFQLHTLTEGQY